MNADLKDSSKTSGNTAPIFSESLDALYHSSVKEDPAKISPNFTGGGLALFSEAKS
ncbi:hypothetical protein ACU8KH_00011 [Lachancea thermotolerans]